MAASTNFCTIESVVLGYAGQTITPSPMTMSFPKDKLVALVGPNGSGKTTLLNAILGEQVLRDGDIFLGDAGLSVQKCKASDLPELIAFVPQEHVYPHDLQVGRLMELAFIPKMGLFGGLPAGALENINRTLKGFGLEKYRNSALRSLSSGERQRAFLARALLQNAQILILDEPTNHLDPGAVHRFWKQLLDSRSTNRGDIIVSTHDLGFVKNQSDWVCALQNGAVVFNGPTTQFEEQRISDKLFDLV